MRGLPLLALLAATALSLSGQSRGVMGDQQLPRVTSISFDPDSFHAGEKVRARVALGPESAGLQPFSIGRGQGSTLDSTPDLEILSATLAATPSGWLYTVSFVVWAPGAGKLPSLSISGRHFPSIDFLAKATTGPDDRVPGPRRPQVDPPGTALYLYAAVALLAVLVLLVLAGVFWVLPGARALLETWRSRGAFRAFSKTLDWLEANIDGPEREWYALLSRSLRIYLARRLIPEAEALTPTEIAQLSPSCLPEKGFREGLSSLLGESDKVRFAGLARGQAGRGRATRQARDLVELVEGWAADSAKGQSYARA